MDSSLLYLSASFLLNLALLAFFFGRMDQRVRALESDVDRMKGVSDRVDHRVQDLAVGISRLEERLDLILDALNFVPSNEPPVTRRKPRSRAKLVQEDAS